MTNTPFSPENYPRVYKQAFEYSVFPGMIAYFSLFYLIFDAVKFGDANFHEGEGMPLACLLFSAVWYLGWAQARLRLTAEEIAFRGRFSLFWQRMRRDDILGIRSIVTPGNQPYFWPYLTEFVPTDPNAEHLTVSMIFKLDDAFDGWVKTLPFLGGTYVDDNAPVYYIRPDELSLMDWQDHMWQPRRPNVFRAASSPSMRRGRRKRDQAPSE